MMYCRTRTCTRNWGKHKKNTTYTSGTYTKSKPRRRPRSTSEQSGPKEPAPATTEMPKTTKELQLRNLCNTTLSNCKHLLLPTTGMSSACPKTANHLGNCTACITGDVDHCKQPQGEHCGPTNCRTTIGLSTTTGKVYVLSKKGNCGTPQLSLLSGQKHLKQ